MLRLPHIVLLAAFVVLSLLSPLVSAQSPKDVIDNRDFLKWQNRVNNLTSEVVSESSAVPDAERSLYLALLAQSWWKVDESEARVYLKKAADKLLAGIQPDEKTDRSQKIRFIQKSLSVIAGLDESLGQTLVGKIDAENENANKKDDADMADLFANLGLQVVQANPQMAFNCGMKSMKFGRSRNMPRLIFELFAKDNRLGETLLRNGLQLARGVFSDANFGFVGNIGTYIFDSRPGRVIPDDLRRSYLEIFAELVAGAAEIESEKPKRCQIAFSAPPILPRIDEYLPALSQTVRQHVQTCLAYLPTGSREYTTDRIRTDGPSTAEESISAARGTSFPIMKVRYFMLAISKFAAEKKFEEIISLLDGMNEDEMKIFGGEMWDDLRGTYAFEACRVYYKSRDMQAYYRVVNRTPKRVRPYVRFRMREEISAVKDREFYLENAEDIGKDLRSLEIKPSVAAGSYLILMNMYLKVQPTEADKVFRDAVKAINIVDGENSDYLAEKDYYSGMDVIPLAAEMLDIDEIGFTNSLAAISSRRSRVRLKLGLLEPSLSRYVEEKKKLEEKLKPKAVKPKS